MEAEALALLANSLDDNFVAACQTILKANRRVVVTGMGKSGHIGRKVAATFAATGTPAMYIHPAEASHGDLGMLAEVMCCSSCPIPATRWNCARS